MLDFSFETAPGFGECNGGRDELTLLREQVRSGVRFFPGHTRRTKITVNPTSLRCARGAPRRGARLHPSVQTVSSS